MRRKPLSLPQIVILALLWITICYIILTGSEHIDGPLILSIIISGALVFIPLLKYLKERVLSPIDITLQMISSNVFWGSILAFPTALFVMRRKKDDAPAE